MQRIDQIISSDTVAKVFELYRDTSNVVEIDGHLADRHFPSGIGHFMVSKFTNDEFDFLWKEVSSKLPGYELVYCRVLKFIKGCYIDSHIDSYSQGDQESNHSLIVQICRPESYAGGLPSVNDETHFLKLKDALLYRYDEEHAVTPIRKGIRYVVNLRLKVAK